MRSFPQSTCVSSAAIRFGDVVQFDVNVASANHRIVKSSTMANVPNVLSSAFLGIAAETPDQSTLSATSPGAECLVYIATPWTEFLFPTKSSAITSTVVGKRCAIGYDSTLSMFYADFGNSTAGDATVVITDVPDPGTDANNPVVVKFLSTACARLISGAF